MSEQWMSIVEYARAFSVSDMTVRRRIKNGKLNAVLKDGKYFIQANGKVSGLSVDQTSMEPMAPPSIHRATSVNNSISEFKVEKGGAVLSPRGWNHDPDSEFGTKSVLQKPEQTKDPEIQNLIEYCNRSLNRITSIEKHLAESYNQKYARLEAELKVRNLEIAQLKQKVEDLQILIKMYDKSS